MKIIYLGLNDRKNTILNVEKGEIPSNHLYGFVELRKMGFEVQQYGIRNFYKWEKIFEKINNKFGTNVPSIKVLAKIKGKDVVVVNGPVSTVITIVCRVTKKKVIYLDSILREPRNYLRKLVYRFNLKMASGTIIYSEEQRRRCREFFGVSEACFKLIPFSIDMSFFLQHASAGNNLDNVEEKYVLSVGRDQARDYSTLVRAMDGLGIKLKIVTLPYLLDDVDVNLPFVEVFENLSYEELFSLYRGASLVVIPLKKWGTRYSSGTTSLLEAIALNKRVIATDSKPMREYVASGCGVTYVDPENIGHLRQLIEEFFSREMAWPEAAEGDRKKVIENYDISRFARNFGDYLHEIAGN